ncbi:hypothetical protein MCNF_15830 [Mycolicibacterium confluentis]|uniref:Uncharacterized protein n=1 Tax=Mycolicibacterium confluentis TaxID=28047 RepID=A0A7I7XUP7_9MYCO|nr:hypothetical protein MCNF_15830 [Mycolicibacterium confluentis]
MDLSPLPFALTPVGAVTSGWDIAVGEASEVDRNQAAENALLRHVHHVFAERRFEFRAAVSRPGVAVEATTRRPPILCCVISMVRSETTREQHFTYRNIQVAAI